MSEQCPANRVLNGAEDMVRIPKPNFSFGWVDIYIDLAGLQIQE